MRTVGEPMCTLPPMSNPRPPQSGDALTDQDLTLRRGADWIAPGRWTRLGQLTDI
jgi:hypothetical protein